MKFFRLILGKSHATAEDEAQTEAEDEAEAPAPAESQPATLRDDGDDDPARDLVAQREFQRGLSELARRQLQYEQFRWEPSTQTDPRGTWFAIDELEAEWGVVRRGTALQFVEPVDGAGGRRWRLRTAKGELVELDVDSQTGGTPAGLSRTTDGGEG